MRVLCKAVLIILSGRKEKYFLGYLERTGWNLRVNCLLFLALYCCNVPEGKDMSWV